MNRKIRLSENHTRALSSSLIVIDKSLSDLEEMLLNQKDTCCNVLMRDIDEKTIEENISVIREAKGYICELAEKYGTSQEKLSLQRIINAKRAKIWEILIDTLSGKIKGYGTFPRKYVEEYDADIKKLIGITGKINH